MRLAYYNDSLNEISQLLCIVMRCTALSDGGVVDVCPTELPPDKAEAGAELSDHVFVAFARVFSGTVRQGQKLYILGPKHDPAKALLEVTIIKKHL